MNILPHKSWHVWTQKNVDKVRKDEEEHRQQEERKRKRDLDIEQEARLEALRQRNKRLKGEPVDDSSLLVVKREDRDRGALVAVKNEEDEREGQAVVAAAAAPEEPLKHVNFFEDLELQQRSEDTRNPEYEAEKKAKADREARQYTTYLGQSAAETQKVKPWYFGPPEATPSLPPEKLRKQERFKSEKDPLAAMGVFLQKKKQIEAVQAKQNSATGGTPAMLARSMKIAAQMAAGTTALPTTSTSIVAASADERKIKSEDKEAEKETKEKKAKKKEKKKRKKEKRKRRKRASSSSPSSDSDDGSDGAEAKKEKLMKLREDRLRREAEAKGKTRQLLFGNQGQTPTSGAYSSQFAPHIGGTLRAQDRERRTQDRERRESLHHRHDDSSSRSSSHHHGRQSSSSSRSSSSRYYSGSGRLEGRERGGASLRDDY